MLLQRTNAKPNQLDIPVSPPVLQNGFCVCVHDCVYVYYAYVFLYVPVCAVHVKVRGQSGVQQLECHLSDDIYLVYLKELFIGLELTKVSVLPGSQLPTSAYSAPMLRLAYYHIQCFTWVLILVKQVNTLPTDISPTFRRMIRVF